MPRITTVTTKTKSYILLLPLLVLMGCSTQKNTWATRTYHQTKVRYNIMYNGGLSYEEGLLAINNANEDDFSQVIPLYPVSNHQAASAATSQMDKTIEKSRKSIKLHSIKKKPATDPKRKSDPDYKRWLQSEEFNAQMGKAWIRLGEAEFHKADFLGAVSTFQYVANHYANDPDMVAMCQLWMARSYGELGWLYEAEDMLDKVQVDALSKKHSRFYSAVKADVLLKTQHYHQAIPFVKIAMPGESRRVYRPRFAYVLGQLYERDGRREDALSAYRQVVKMAPPVVMDFSARVRMATLSGSVKKLRSMTRQSKYKDQLDQLYGAMGDIALASGDTTQALEHYQKAIDSATKPGLEKATVLVHAGDLYYERQQYAEAQPCYREAVTILTQQNPDFERIQLRSEVLDELVLQHNTVLLQDSLQRLSRMTEEEQRQVVDDIIKRLVEKEKQDSIDAAQAARDARNDGGLQSVNTQNMLGGSGASADWYFYNAQLMRVGRQEFHKRWGTRPLEDDWRRLNKQVVQLPDMSDADEDDEMDNESDSTQVADRPTVETDTHKPEYYLQQIPRTEADLAASDSLLREALIQMVYIYLDKMNEPKLAEATFAELQRRFPGHASLKDLYYTYYIRALRAREEAEAKHYADELMRLYPDSKEAYIVSQPGYFDRLRRMAQEQDSLYEATYRAYTAARFDEVKAHKNYAEQNYPLSPLMPRFLFLNAISVARTDGQDAFAEALRDIVSRYADSEMAAMAKNMLSMMGQGLESQQGETSTSSLADLRQQTDEPTEEESTDELAWDTSRMGRSVVLLILPEADEQALNRLQYEVALFNFAQFMIRDFDLYKMPVLLQGCALRVAGFESLDDAEWWSNLTEQSEQLRQVMTEMQVQKQPLLEANLPLYQKGVVAPK